MFGHTCSLYEIWYRLDQRTIDARLSRYRLPYFENMICLLILLGSARIDFESNLRSFSSNRFTLVAWDSPGCGRSRQREPDFNAGYQSRNADIAYQLMKVGSHFQPCSSCLAESSSITDVYRRDRRCRTDSTIYRV